MSALLDATPKVLRDIALEIDPAEVLRFQGYKASSGPPSPAVSKLFDEAMALGRRLMAPAAVVRWLPVIEGSADALEIPAEVLNISGIGARWGRVELVAAAVCTIGDAVEQRVRELWNARELPLAAMLDSVGSAAAESLAEYVNDVLCHEGLAHGLRVTNRISPGYGSWDVREQSLLFRLCPGAAVGVALNAACFMTPEKSITLLVGAGVTAHVDDYFSQCARCWMAACAYRRVPARRRVHR